MLAPRPIWLPVNRALLDDDLCLAFPPASAIDCSTRCRYFLARLLPRDRIFPSFGLKSSSRVTAIGGYVKNALQAKEAGRARALQESRSVYVSSMAYAKKS